MFHRPCKALSLIRPLKSNLSCQITYKSCRESHSHPFQHAREMKNSVLKNILKQNSGCHAVPVASFHRSSIKVDPVFKDLRPTPITSFDTWKGGKVPTYEGIELPPLEKRRLPIYHKVPQTLMSTRPYKMPKSHRYIRGEEEVHTDFIHRQYGIVAMGGGHLLHGHFEMMRNGINRKLNMKKAFAIYRVEAPWFSHTKKAIGVRMGGGMGNISYYSTPVKEKRVILEVAGMIVFEEVERMLRIVAHKLPFPAAVMTQEMIEKQREEEKRLERENTNRFTFKYIVQNNMMGSRFWAKKDLDLKWFGKYN